MKELLLMFVLLTSYVGSPAHIPNFDNFTTPALEPGHSGVFNFTIQNRYVAPMYGTVLDIEIYKWATTDGSMDITSINPHPYIVESKSLEYTVTLGTINPGQYAPVRFHVYAPSGTPDGVYFVRFHLRFTYNGSVYKMWSPGYFTKEEWDKATENNTLNLQYLSYVLGDKVDGIIPDSSFSVQSSMLWILYVLTGASAVVGIFAVYFLVKDAKKVNKLDENIYRLKGKYKHLEREIKKKLKKTRQNP